MALRRNLYSAISELFTAFIIALAKGFTEAILQCTARSLTDTPNSNHQQDNQTTTIPDEAKRRLVTHTM